MFYNTSNYLPISVFSDKFARKMNYLLKNKNMKTVALFLMTLLSVGAMSQNKLSPLFNGQIEMDWVVEEIVLDTEKTYLDLRREYKKYCNQEITDTIKELGLIFRVIEEDHDTLIIRKDTIWSDNILFQRYFINYDNGNTTYIDSLSRVRIETRKREVESPEGFWNWIDKNYLK